MLLRALVALLAFTGSARADLAAADARASSCVAALTAARDWTAAHDRAFAKLAVTADAKGVVVRGSECDRLDVRVWRDAKAHDESTTDHMSNAPPDEHDLWCGKRSALTRAGMGWSASVVYRDVEPAVAERFWTAIDVCLRTPETRARDERWHASCALQLRVARERLVARDPFFRDLKLDEKLMQVHLGGADGEAYSVQVIPRYAMNDWADSRSWSVGGWDDCFGTCEAKVWQRRTATMFRLGAHSAAFADAFRPAADRCLDLP